MIIDFYFDFTSPMSYLAHMRLKQFSEKYSFEVNYCPVLLGAIFKALGSYPPLKIPSKRQYLYEQDLPRFVDRYQVAFYLPEIFPVNTLSLLRGSLTKEVQPFLAEYIDLFFKAIWQDRLDVHDQEVVNQLIAKLPINYEDWVNQIGTNEIKDALKEKTSQAIDRGVFGVPTFFIGEEMFFGQDRLDFIEERLSQ